MSSASIQQSMKQSMVASQSLQMFMRTLQATSSELAEITNQALASNPTLEEASPVNAQGHLATERHSRFLESLAEEESLHDHLSEQIRHSGLEPQLANAALMLCQQLDARGFFEEAPVLIAQREEMSPTLFAKALSCVQELDPSGVGARDIRESLLLQLDRLGERKGIAHELIELHWHALLHRHYAQIAKMMEVEEAAVSGAVHRIALLNPDPGSNFCRAELNIISPDVIIEQQGDELMVSLTGEQIPLLSLSADYRSMMSEQAQNQELRQYLSKCFREGRELIHAIEQRQQTILLVARAIVVRQREYFTQDASALQPLKMEQIAEDCELHISTISRAVKGKYIKSKRGLAELRSFFSSSISSSEVGGSSYSAGAIHQRIAALIADEDPRKPLSDAKLETALAHQGVSISRRTIAKYREQLNILPTSLRKLR